MIIIRGLLLHVHPFKPAVNPTNIKLNHFNTRSLQSTRVKSKTLHSFFELVHCVDNSKQLPIFVSNIQWNPKTISSSGLFGLLLGRHPVGH